MIAFYRHGRIQSLGQHTESRDEGAQSRGSVLAVAATVWFPHHHQQPLPTLRLGFFPQSRQRLLVLLGLKRPEPALGLLALAQGAFSLRVGGVLGLWAVGDAAPASVHFLAPHAPEDAAMGAPDVAAVLGRSGDDAAAQRGGGGRAHGHHPCFRCFVFWSGVAFPGLFCGRRPDSSCSSRSGSLSLSLALCDSCSSNYPGFRCLPVCGGFSSRFSGRRR